MLSIAHFAKTDRATRTTIFQAQERGGHSVFVVVPKLPVCVVPGASFSISAPRKSRHTAIDGLC